MSELKPCPFCGGEAILESNKLRYGTIYSAYCQKCGAEITGFSEHEAVAAWNRRAQPDITGETSDGYHTFNELYHHRAVLFSAICNSRPDIAWRAKRHHDGTMYNGMFIVGINTPDGQATYHYDVEPYWEMFRVPELLQAPEWDGHTPAQAIERIWKLSTQPANEPLTLKQPEIVRCEDCTYYCPASDGHGGEMHYGFCINRHDGTCGVTRDRYERDFCSYGERKDGDSNDE